MAASKNRPLLAAGVAPEIAGVREPAKMAYNLWLGGIDVVFGKEKTPEIEMLRRKVCEETGESKEFAVVKKTKSKTKNKTKKKTKNKNSRVAAAKNLKELFGLAARGKGKTKKIDVTRIIRRNTGSEITAAKACRLAVGAAIAGIPLETYAGMHRNLAIAMAGEGKMKLEISQTKLAKRP